MGIIKRISTYLCITIITLLLTIINAKALNLKEYINIDCCKAMTEKTLYTATGRIDLYDKQMGLELKSVQRNGIYYITLSGTPTISNGKVHFTGMTKDNDTIEVNYEIDVVVGRNNINVTKTYNAVAGTSVGNVLVYESDKNLSSVNTTRNGLTLKTANIGGKYGLYLVGTPEGAGTVTFTGTTYDDGNSGSNNTYNVNYTVTINVTPKERTNINVTKSYNGTVGKSLGDILVYQTSGDHGDINSTKNGITLKTEKDGLRLSGTPTKGGVITFSGYFTDGDDYKVNYSVTVNVPNPNKQQVKVERLYNAVVGKDIGKVLVYENTAKLPDMEKTEKGVTLKTETENNKTKIYLTGKPTEDGQVVFSGTLDEGNRDIVYYVVVTIAKKGSSTNNNTNNNTSNNGTNNKGSNNNNSNGNNNNNTVDPTNSDDNNENKAVEPVEPNNDNNNKQENKKENNNNDTNNDSKEESKEENKINDLIVPVAIGAGVLILLLVIIKATTKKKKAL